MRISSRVAFVAAVLAAAAPAQVVINEFNTGTPDFIELRNLSTSTAAAVGGWTVNSWYRVNAAGAHTAEATFTIPAGTTIPPQGFLVLQENGTAGQPGTLGACSISVGFNYNWAAAYSVEISLRNAGVGVDYVFRNNFGQAGNPNLPPGTTFSGVHTGSGDRCSRNTDTDTNAAADWITVAGAGTPCAINPGQALATPVVLSITTTGAGDVTVGITSNPPLANAEFYNFYSTQDFTPNGIGPFFGVGFDALPQVYYPLIPNTPFHSNLDAAGTLNVSYPPGTLPPGFFVEGVSVVLNGPALVLSNVVQRTF